MLRDIAREGWFLRRERLAVATIIAATVLATITIVIGIADVSAQRATIAALDASTTADLENTLADQYDAGSAAYYGFRLVVDPPSELAFAASGIRDELPWKHRIRSLALEGQIYENDAGNPELTQLGRIDYAFLVSVLAPLLVILLLHDIVDGERRQNRYDLLAVTAGDVRPVIRWRVLLRGVALAVALLLPFVIAAMWFGARFAAIATIAGATLAYVVAWSLVVMWVAKRMASATTAAATLLGGWTVLVLVIPLTAGAIAERTIDVPQGGEILLEQREIVNRAWDIPEEATMDAFHATHPEWADYKPVYEGFNWMWYYAFQQVGDQSVAEISTALRDGVRERDAFMARAAWLSPPLLVDRLFTRLAKTDINAFQRYDQCVRNFHETLRKAHYPMLYGIEPFDVEKLLALDKMKVCS
ncbi:MAG: DUF3526 domain-containing protein [Pseudomonadota bacterium]